MNSIPNYLPYLWASQMSQFSVYTMWRCAPTMLIYSFSRFQRCPRIVRATFGSRVVSVGSWVQGLGEPLGHLHRHGVPCANARRRRPHSPHCGCSIACERPCIDITCCVARKWRYGGHAGWKGRGHGGGAAEPHGGRACTGQRDACKQVAREYSPRIAWASSPIKRDVPQGGAPS